MSEQQAEPISGESGSLGAGPAAPDSSDAPARAGRGLDAGTVEGSIEGSTSVDSPKLVPEQGAVEEMPKVDRAQGPMRDKADADKAETSKAEMPPGRRAAHPWQGHDHVGRRSRLGRRRRRSGAGIRAELGNVRQAPARRTRGGGGAGGGGRCARWRGGDREPRAFGGDDTATASTTTRSKRRLRGSMPIFRR